MFDEKAKALLALGILNDAFGDVRNMIYYLRDYAASQEWEDIERFGIAEVINSAVELEKLILRKMDFLKKLLESK